MSTFTKSLHTVTAVRNVAKHLVDTNPVINTPEKALARSIHVLGYDIKSFGKDDPTIEACRKTIKKDMGK